MLLSLLLLGTAVPTHSTVLQPGQRLSITQSSPLVLVSALISPWKQHVRAELVLGRDFLPGESCAFMVRKGVEPELGAAGQLQADLIDISAWQLRKSQHYIAFSSDFLEKSGSFYLGIAYFRPFPSSPALSYEISLSTSDSPLCPGDCSKAGLCSTSDLCECYHGYFDQDCSVAPPMLFVGQTDMVQVPANQYFFVFFGTEEEVAISLYWRLGVLDIMWRNTDKSSALPVYTQVDEGVWNVTVRFNRRFESDSGKYLLALFNPTDKDLRVSIALVASSSSQNSSVVIVVICSILGFFIAVLWGVYIYCKVKYRHTARIVPEMYIETEPNWSILLSLFPVEDFASLIGLNSACSVCLDAFRPTDKVRILLCSHVYHVDCIDKWLKQQSVRNTQFCCMCKRDYSRPEELLAEAQRFKAAKIGETTRNEQESTFLNPTEAIDFTFSHPEPET